MVLLEIDFIPSLLQDTSISSRFQVYNETKFWEIPFSLEAFTQVVSLKVVIFTGVCQRFYNTTADTGKSDDSGFKLIHSFRTNSVC